MSHTRTGSRRTRHGNAPPRRGLVFASLIAVVLAIGAVAMPAPAGAQQGAELTIGVLCREGAIGAFVITLRRDGMVVGSPRTLECDGRGAQTTFGDLTPGTYTVAETAGPGTDLANYRTFWSCGGEFRSGTGFSVELAAGGRARCEFLNELVRSGTLELRKECRGRSTAGRFRLGLEGTGLALDVRCGELVLARVPPGSYAVVETAAPGTDLAAYLTFTFCRTGQLGPISVGGTRTSGVVVRQDERTVCTITNIYLRPF